MTDRCQYLVDKSKFFDLRDLNTADDGKTSYFTVPAKDQPEAQLFIAFCHNLDADFLESKNCSKSALTAAILYNSLDYSCQSLTNQVNDDEHQYMDLSSISNSNDKEFVMHYLALEKTEPLHVNIICD